MDCPRRTAQTLSFREARSVLEDVARCDACDARSCCEHEVGLARREKPPEAVHINPLAVETEASNVIAAGAEKKMAPRVAVRIPRHETSATAVNPLPHKILKVTVSLLLTRSA